MNIFEYISRKYQIKKGLKKIDNKFSGISENTEFIDKLKEVETFDIIENIIHNIGGIDIEDKYGCYNTSLLKQTESELNRIGIKITPEILKIINKIESIILLNKKTTETNDFSINKINIIEKDDFFLHMDKLYDPTFSEKGFLMLLQSFLANSKDNIKSIYFYEFIHTLINHKYISDNILLDIIKNNTLHNYSLLLIKKEILGTKNISLINNFVNTDTGLKIIYNILLLDNLNTDYIDNILKPINIDNKNKLLEMLKQRNFHDKKIILKKINSSILLLSQINKK